MARPVIVVVMAVALSITIGCDGDARYRELATELSREQSEQNQKMADVQNRANATVQAGIESNDRARQELAAQRTDVREQTNQLDNERRQIAVDRHWDAKATSAFLAMATVLAALSPLLLAAYYIQQSCSPASIQEAVHEIFIQDAADAINLMKESGKQLSPNKKESLKRLL
jgi:hypothetical protein